MLLVLVWLAIVGLVVGAVARALVPGPDAMGILGTICLGLAGSFIGGLLVGLLLKPNDGQAYSPVGFIGSVVGAVVLLLLFRAASGRTTARYR
jgi:uncharacterized membrane protein YeaQ/YmgE (transglycosylase-associated protein family)